MQRRAIPSFTRRGFIQGSVFERADFLLAYFFETLPSQSWLFRADNVSAQFLLAKYGEDIYGLMEAFRDELTKRFNKYFDDCIIEVSLANEASFKVDGKANILIQIQLRDSGKDYVFHRQFNEMNGVFRLVVERINYGNPSQ